VRLALMLLLAVRTYYPVSIADLAAGKNFHTHVQVTGKVTLVKHEGDGDTHIVLSDGKNFVVVECIPELPCQAPKVGQTVTAEGIYRQDYEHRWFELHPCEKLTIQKGGAR
jgi:hypothetical protein